jgi:LemA protein
MSVTAYTMLVLIGVLCIYAVLTYNRLVALRNHVQKAWSNIEIVLKQRHDELPKLVAVCREYMRFEQETLERVIAARSRVAEARERRDVDALGARIFAFTAFKLLCFDRAETEDVDMRALLQS